MINSTAVKTTYKWIFRLFLMALLASCKTDSSAPGKDDLVKVYDKVLTKSEVRKVVPADYTGVDSTDIADKYVQEWVNKELMLQKALLNVDNGEEIEQMVQEYRNSLIISKYMEQLVVQKADSEVTEKEIADYYNKNPEAFLLKEELTTGIFLKIPLESPRLDLLKNWIKNRSEDDLVELENYCFQNAQKYENFTDKWLPVKVVSKYLPDGTNVNAFVPGVTIERADSLSRYYVLVFDKKETGDEAPLLYVKAQIIKIIQHRKKLEYIARFKKDILDEAIENKKLEYYENN